MFHGILCVGRLADAVTHKPPCWLAVLKNGALAWPLAAKEGHCHMGLARLQVYDLLLRRRSRI